MESKLFKRILSLTTAVFMVLTMLPTTVFAVDVSTDVEDLENTQTSSAQVECPCAKCNGEVPKGGWTALSVTEGALAEGHYYVPLPAEDETTYQLTNYIEIKNASVVIDLRGNTITAESTTQSFRIDDNGSLTILDSSDDETGVVYGATAAIGEYGGNIYLEAASGTTAVFNLYSGTIANGTSGTAESENGQGGNIRAGTRCTVNLYGGEVTGGKTNYRAGNISISTGTLNIYNDAKVTDGSIIDIRKGTTGNYGGNIYATTRAKINMYDNAVVSGGRANQGGNICIFSGVTFNMYGGAIYDGSAIKYNDDGTVADATYIGPDLYAAGTGNGHFYMYGGDVGKTYCSSSCTFHLYNGTLSADPTNYLAPCAAAFKSVDATGATKYAVYQTALSDAGACEAGTACGHTYVQTPASTVNSKTTHLAVKMASCKFCQKMVAWAPMFNDNIALDHVYMVNDIALQEQLALTSGDALCMDMNGYDLTGAAELSRVILATKATLNITNSADTASEILANGGGAITVEGGSLSLHNISVTGGAGTGYGGNINAGSGAEITLEDCTITGGTAVKNGGNICCYASDLIIKGDTKITGGTATGNGGNIYLGTTSNMYMYSGEVSGGTGDSGEDICFLPSTGSFYLYDGTIGPAKTTSKTSLQIYNYDKFNASFYMYGGTVHSIGVGSKNSAPAGGKLLIYAGTIGNDPTVANYGSTTMVAACSTSTANDNGTYTVTHNGHTFDQKIEADEHKVNDANCTAPLTYYYSCTCGETNETTFSVGEKDATVHANLRQVDAQAPTCTAIGWEAYEYCESCDHITYSELAATGHTLTQVEAQAPACEAVGWNAYEYCSVCDHTTYTEIAATGHSYGDWSDNGDGNTHSRTCATDSTHVETVEHKYESVVTAPNCTETGYTTYTCKDCGYSYEGDETATNDVHAYDEFGDCTRCDAAVSAKVTDLEGNVTYYEDVTTALTAANGTGATVCVLKNTTVVLKDSFGSAATALNSITISTAEGVTLSDDSGGSSDKWYMKDVTFAQNCSVDLAGYAQIPSGEVHIYGDVCFYMITVSGTLTVYGTDGGRLRTKGNTFLGGQVNIIGDGGEDIIAEFNTNTATNTLAIDTCQLTVQNAKVVCDTLNLRKAASRVILTDASITCNKTGYSSHSLTHSCYVQDSSQIIMNGESALTLTGTIGFSETDGKVIMSEDSTLTTTTAEGAANSNIVVADGFDGCVWYEDGAYAAKAHNGADATCTEDGLCTNCNVVVNEATGEHSYVGVRTEATATSNAYTTYTCTCGDTYTEVEEGTMLHYAVNETTGESYASVQAALNAASKGDTVKLLKDATEEDLYVGAKKTLDLNGHELTAAVVTAPFATSYIIDSTNGGGLLIVDKDKISLNGTNSYLPLWYDEGARFITVEFGRALDFKDKTGAANENVAYYRFAFTDPAAKTLLDDFLANGTEGTGISVRIKATWTNANGIVTQYFTFTSEMVEEYVIEKGWDNAQFQMYLSGVAGLDISFEAEIVSSANPQATVVIASTATS